MMSLLRVGRLAAVIAMTAALAGCIDETIDVKVVSETEALGTVTQTIAASAYLGMKADPATNLSSNFCKKQDGGMLVENEDGSASCTFVHDGKFDDLQLDRNETITFNSAGPGLVKVAFPTGGVSQRIAAVPIAEDSDLDGDQVRKKIAPQLAGHYLTLRVEGGTIVDTNMTLSTDKQAAEERISLIDILSGTKYPDAFYAVVKLP